MVTTDTILEIRIVLLVLGKYVWNYVCGIDFICEQGLFSLH